MFDIGISELLLIAVVALIAVGPQDLPGLLFRLGRFTRQVKIFLGGIRDQYSEIMHEAEVEHYRKEMTKSLTIRESDLQTTASPVVTTPQPEVKLEPEVKPEPSKEAADEQP